MKKAVLVFMILFWTFYVAIVSVGLYDNFFGKKELTNPNPSNLNNSTDIILNEAEVSKHNKVSDCWSIIGGKVYNLSPYLDKHPGRADTILPYCGTNGDKGYRTKDKIIAVAHSAFADTLLAKYLLGDLGQTLKASSQNTAPTTDAPTTVNNTPQSTSSSTNVSLSSSEVAKHNSSADCWFVISNKVYNVTSYFGSHPGGDNRLSSYCGKDATSAFTGLPHSLYANNLLTKYLIGSLGTTATINNNQGSQNINNNASTPLQSGDDNEVEEDD